VGRLEIRACIGLALLGASCVLPNDPVTGVEFAWHLSELNDADGPEALRARTCEGQLLSSVELEITDVDDEARSRSFAFDCARGQFDATSATPDVFVDLRPGTYDLTFIAVDDPADRGAEGPVTRVLSEDRELTVGSGLVFESWVVEGPPLDFELRVTGSDSCSDFSLALAYSDPDSALIEPLEIPDEDPPPPALYRETLVSDLGLLVDGLGSACAELDPGPHRLEALDRGEYSLIVTVDGATCAIPVLLDGLADASLDLDLANLPC
jgi:hypothetical protein